MQHPLEESRDCLAFATEPVYCSLANALGRHENMPQPVPKHIREYKLFDVEIKYGLLQVSETKLDTNFSLVLREQVACLKMQRSHPLFGARQVHLEM